MSLADELTDIYTRLGSALDDVNSALAEKGVNAVSDVSSIAGAISEITGSVSFMSVTKEMTDFSCFAHQNRFNDIIGCIHTQKATNMYSMFEYCDELIDVPSTIATSKCTDLRYMFYGCSNLTSVPEIALTAANLTDYMFGNCANLTEVTLVTPQTDLSATMFIGCTSLQTVNISTSWNVSIYLHYSENLTQECLHGMIERLADVSNAETAPIFQIGSTNLAKIDEEHIAMLDAKGWRYS